MARNRLDLIGSEFGRLTVIEDLGYTKLDGTRATSRLLKCMCECGNTVIVSYSNLQSGRTKSCGCLGGKNGNTKKNYYYTETIDGVEVAHVKLSNSDNVALVNKEDWENLKDSYWHETKGGYAAAWHNGKLVTMQVALIPNVLEGHERDHINRNRLDNRRCNLRVVSKLENLINREYSNKTSKQTGVCWYSLTSQWLAYIRKDGKQYNLGLFDNEEDAIAVRLQAEEDLGFVNAA